MPRHSAEADEIDETGPVIIAGDRALRADRQPPRAVERLRHGGARRRSCAHPADAALRRQGVLRRPDPARTAARRRAAERPCPRGRAGRARDGPQLVAFARQERPDLRIVARARDRTHVFRLYQAGADKIVRELFDSSLRAGRYVLESIGVVGVRGGRAGKDLLPARSQVSARTGGAVDTRTPPRSRTPPISPRQGAGAGACRRCCCRSSRKRRTDDDEPPDADRHGRLIVRHARLGEGRHAGMTGQSAPCRMPMASAAPEPSPSRMPSAGAAALPSRQQPPCAASALSCPATA